MSRKKKRTKVLTILSVLLIAFGSLAVVIGFSLTSTSKTESSTYYSATKPCQAYDQNGELAAWVNLTITTNASVPQPNVPINVTLWIRGIYVPSGNWTYAVLEGATAAFPSKEPNDWNHEVKNVIVLKQLNYPFDYYGTRVMNYTYGGTWNIFLYVVADTIFIVNNIPPNPTNLPVTIYTVPNAVDIASAESIAQMKASEESAKTNTFWIGIAFIFAGIALILPGLIELVKQFSLGLG